MRCSFAEFLVERGSISDAEGACVSTWAKQNRDLLGSIAMEHGLLTSEQIRAVVRFQRDRGGLFGDACVELGYFDRDELDLLLDTQGMRTSRYELERLVLGGLVRTADVDGLLSGFYEKRTAEAA